MARLTLVRVQYAWNTPASSGRVYDTPEAARADAPPEAAELLAVYVVASDGRIIHTHPAEEDSP